MGFLLDILYPKNFVCALCGREAPVPDTMICDDCAAGLVRNPPVDCPAPLDGIRSGLAYTPALRTPVASFKYRRNTWYAPIFAQFMELPAEWHIDCIVPVPLHPLRRLWRTFNQSELLARHVSDRFHIPVNTKLLRRVRYTKPQARLAASKRLTNLDNAFVSSPAASGRDILLIDDVTTTHTTLLACASELKRRGAAHVYALTAFCAVSSPTKTDKNE